MSKAEATTRLTDCLVNQWPGEDARFALRRMRQMIHTPGWGPDILVKILPDVDMAFFNGRSWSIVGRAIGQKPS